MEQSNLIQYLNSLEAVGIPGCDCVVYQNHIPVFRHITGFADTGSKKPLTDTTAYWLYSASKLITCTAVMQLVEKGKIGLDDPVSRFLPEYGAMKVKKGAIAVDATRPMSIRHLLTMQSGLNYNLKAPSIVEILRETNGEASTRQIIRALAQEPLDFEPGTRYQYSLSHDVLGAVIQEVAGQSLGVYFEEQIFLPLGMKNTGFELTADRRHCLSEQFTYLDDSKTSSPISSENAFVLSKNYESGGAGLISTVNDFILFLDTMCNGGTSVSGYQLLTRESIDRMREDELHGQSKEDFALYGKTGYSYGLGVRTLIEREPFGIRSPLGEFGWDGAAGAYALIDVQHKLAIFYAQHVVNCDYVYKVIHPKIRNLVYDMLEIQ